MRSDDILRIAKISRLHIALDDSRLAIGIENLVVKWHIERKQALTLRNAGLDKSLAGLELGEHRARIEAARTVFLNHQLAGFFGIVDGPLPALGARTQERHYYFLVCREEVFARI